MAARARARREVEATEREADLDMERAMARRDAIENYLPTMTMTVEAAERILDPTDEMRSVGCACLGSPQRRAGAPCFCELNVMKAQQMTGQPVTGWER